MRLHVVMLDTWRTQMAILYENETVPYGRRAVVVELTEEQAKTLSRRCVGVNGGRDVYEDIGDVCLEDDKARGEG